MTSDLAEIGGEGDDLAVIRLLQPPQDHGGVEAAAVREDDLVDAFPARARPDAGSHRQVAPPAGLCS